MNRMRNMSLCAKVEDPWRKKMEARIDELEKNVVKLERELAIEQHAPGGTVYQKLYQEEFEESMFPPPNEVLEKKVKDLERQLAIEQHAPGGTVYQQLFQDEFGESMFQSPESLQK